MSATQEHCKGCGRPVFWALHVQTRKAAPLVRPNGDMKPNIAVYSSKEPGHEGETLYYITKDDSAEFINHFADCKQAAQFRPSTDRPSKQESDDRREDVENEHFDARW